MLTENEAKQQLQELGRFMIEQALAWGNAGNISIRTGSENFMITASGTTLGELDENDFVECRLHSAEKTHSERKPSKERPMHQAIYEERPEIKAVLHSSPFYSTLIACSYMEIHSNLFVEAMYYLEKIERVSYHHPGSEDLGKAVREKAKQANILLLENHGVLVYDTNIAEARMSLQTLEMTCRMLITAQSSGVKLQHLSTNKVTDFLEHSGYKQRRKWST